MLSDKIGLGLDANYTNTFVDYNQNTTDANGDPATYNYKVGRSVIRAMVRMNVHFATSDVLDPYFNIGAGYRTSSFYFDSSDPNYDASSVSYNFIPFAMRVGAGLRYYFTDNLGINVEVGFGGGSLAAGGITYKL